MKRNLTLRLLMAALIVTFGTIIFSYAHARSTRQEDASGSEGKGECTKCQTPFVLWESLTHNLLISRR